MKQYIIRISVSHSWFGRGEAELLSAPALLHADAAFSENSAF